MLWGGGIVASADWKQEIGFHDLKASGVGLCDGTSIGVSQIEGPLSGNAYLPQSGEGKFLGSDSFYAKRFRAVSGDSPVSSHALRVG
ncbi:MAG: hypothetical protein AAF514_24340, partial [Verrucomicrobiota bacterium]